MDCSTETAAARGHPPTSIDLFAPPKPKATGRQDDAIRRQVKYAPPPSYMKLNQNTTSSPIQLLILCPEISTPLASQTTWSARFIARANAAECR